MAFVLKDRVKETCVSPGTGTVTLLGASSGYQSFSAIGNANTTYYCIADQGGVNWEVGIGTYTASGTTLSRDTVLSSSNGGSLTNFSSGTQDVFVTYPSSRSVYVNSAGSAFLPDTSSTLATTYGGTGLSTYTAGDLPYYATGTALSKLGIGANGTILTSTGSAPQWSAISSLGIVSTISFGTTGLTPSTATSGAVTVAGTLATTNGGTGLTSFTANRVFYASSTSAVGQSANLTFDGTTLTAANFADSSLTAGRVTYAGASGNLTDSASFTFDGTSLTAPIVNASNGILVNGTTVSANYTIASGSNGLSVGPITVGSGISVTVSSGQRWLVL